MFVYQLEGGMGTTLWCKNFFFSMLVVEVNWVCARAHTALDNLSWATKKIFLPVKTFLM